MLYYQIMLTHPKEFQETLINNLCEVMEEISYVDSISLCLGYHVFSVVVHHQCVMHTYVLTDMSVHGCYSCLQDNMSLLAKL